MTRTKGIVCAGHAKTAEAAVIILGEGGNAFDAAAAALLASWVTESCMSSPAGGGFMAGYTEQGKSILFDFFCQTPARKKSDKDLEFFPITVNFGTATEDFHIGAGAIGVPGSLAGFFSIYENLCTLPLKVLASPALEMAKYGVVVDNFQQYAHQLLEPILKQHKEGRDLFFPKNQKLKEGETLCMPGFTDFLETLVIEGKDLFYQGEVGQDLVKICNEYGGHINRDDLQNYQTIIRDPLRFNYDHRQVITNPPPSKGGVLIALMLKVMESHNQLFSPLSGPELLHLQEIFSRAEGVRKSPHEFEAFKKQLHISEKDQPLSPNKWGSTTHINVMDQKGNAVSISSTNGEGCGHYIPGTNIAVNNMLGEAALFPHGFHLWEPNVRISSMMAPTLVLDKNQQVEIVMGSGGAGRIPFAITQVLHNLLEHKLELTQAVENPRVFWRDGVINIEPGYDTQVDFPDEVKEVIEWEYKDMFFGGVHTIFRKNGELQAAGDSRRHGVALYSE